MARCRRPNDSASAFASSPSPCVCPRVNQYAVGSGHSLDVRPCGFSPDDDVIQARPHFVTVRRRSCVAEFFSSRRSATRARILAWPGRSIAFGKHICVVPCGTLAEHTRNRRRSWDFGPSQFLSCPGEPWPRRSASCEIVRCHWCLHLADPLAVCVMPSSIIFRRGIGRSNFFTHIRHKKRTIAGNHYRLLGFSPGQAVPITARSAATGQSCLGHFPLPGVQTSRDALAQARPRTRHRSPATASGAMPLMGFSSMFASPSGSV